MYGDSPYDNEELYGMTTAEAMSRFNDLLEGKKHRPDTYIHPKKDFYDFYLIRHAECEINLQDIIGGRSNHSPLTQKGIQQARDLNSRLRKIDITGAEFKCSPARRCIDTLLHSLDFIPNFEIDPRLQELDQGDWTGEDRKEIYTPEQMEIIQKDYWNFKAPCGKSQAEVANRVKLFLHEETCKKPGKRLIYTHGGVIKYTCTDLFGWDTSKAWKVEVDNASITHIKYNGQKW